jgi:hypothetical protein
MALHVSTGGVLMRGGVIDVVHVSSMLQALHLQIVMAVVELGQNTQE